MLRPGGRLVTADIVPTAAVSAFVRRLQQRASWGLVSSRFAIPADNADTRPVYHAKLALCGFDRVGRHQKRRREDT